MRIGKFQVLESLDKTRLTERFAGKSVLASVQQIVTLKRLVGSLGKDATVSRALLEEARLAALLSHPVIPALYEIVAIDGGNCLVYEHAIGLDVHRLIMASLQRTGRVLLEVAVHLAIGAASALHHAHERRGLDGKPLGIVHGHVSTETLLLTDEGHVKLLGFGSPTASEGMLSYRSPEQLLGQPVDRRTDLFSLGIVLYELVIGRRLFFGNDDAETRRNLLERPIARPAALWPACPPELERILLRALARNQVDRYQTAEELQLDLEELVRARQLAATATRARSYLREIAHDKETKVDKASKEGGPRPSVASILAKKPMPAKSATGDMPAFEIPADAVLSDVVAPPPPPRKSRGRASDT